MPARIGFEIHVRQFPDLASIIDARFQPPRLLLGTHLQPIFEENDAVIDDDLLERGHHFQKPLGLRLGAEPHHPLDAGAVIPAAVEDDDLPRCRQMRDVTLSVHLRLFSLGRRGQRNHPENARAYPLGHRLDRAALAGAIAPFEEDAHLQALVHHPLLELDELDMQACELPLVFVPLQFTVGSKLTLLVGHRGHSQVMPRAL